MTYWVHVYELMNHDRLEVASWIAQIVLTIVAIIAAKLAYDQLVQIRKNADTEVKIANANLLLTLDSRWDRELAASRVLFLKLHDEINTIISTNNPFAGDGEKQRLMCEEWRKQLGEIRKTRKPDYQKLMGIIPLTQVLIDPAPCTQREDVRHSEMDFSGDQALTSPEVRRTSPIIRVEFEFNSNYLTGRAHPSGPAATAASGGAACPFCLGGCS